MAKPKILKECLVRLPAKEYPIIIGHNLLSNEGLLNNLIKSTQILVVSNPIVAPLYLHFLENAFQTRQFDKIILDDGEKYKNQSSLNQIYDVLISKNYHRDSTIIALGGGVIGDIAGFAASTYQRGIGFIQIPTTLLAQVDASIGGKTAINHQLAKNMIGSFYQPDAVLIDILTLETLPKRQMRAGFAEVIKYALLSGRDFFSHVNDLLLKGLDKPDKAKLAQLVSMCCTMKAKIVELDEKESNCRALLNLGHTVGHALEAYGQYKRWLHGEAVGIGLYCAALLSYEKGKIDQDVLIQIDNLLALAELPRRIPNDINLDKLKQLLTLDKKIKNNTLRFVLLQNIGDCYIEEHVSPDELHKVLQHAVEGEDRVKKCL